MKKNIIIALLVLIIIGLASSFGYYYYTNEEKVATNESNDEKGIEDNLILLAVGETVNLSDYVDDISNLSQAVFENGEVFSIDSEYQITSENQGNDVLVLTYKDGKTVKYGVLCETNNLLSIKIGEEGDLTTYIDKEKEVKEITSDNELFTISENKVTTTDEGEAITTIVYTDETEDKVKVKCKTETSNAYAEEKYITHGVDTIQTINEGGILKSFKFKIKGAKSLDKLDTQHCGEEDCPILETYNIWLCYPTYALNFNYKIATHYNLDFFRNKYGSVYKTSKQRGTPEYYCDTDVRVISSGGYQGYYWQTYRIGNNPYSSGFIYMLINDNLIRYREKFYNSHAYVYRSLFLRGSEVYKSSSYKFKGFYTGKNGTGMKYIDSFRHITYPANKINKNMTLYAYVTYDNPTVTKSNAKNSTVTTPTTTLKQQIKYCTNTSINNKSSGNCVRVLKTALEKDSYVRCTGLKHDGVYGSALKKCINKLKKKNRLKEDGIAGSNVWNLLYKSIPNTIAGVQ